MDLTNKNATIIGAGLVGSLWAVYLSRAGYKVTIYERRSDIRKADIQAGKSINSPIYLYSKHMRTDQFIEIFPMPVVLVEGILIFAHKPLREQFTTTIFIDAEDDTRLRRRIARDIQTRGRTPEEVKGRFEDTILPMHNAYIQPHKETSDYIFNNNLDDLSRLSSFCNLVEKLSK